MKRQRATRTDWVYGLREEIKTLSYSKNCVEMKYLRLNLLLSSFVGVPCFKGFRKWHCDSKPFSVLIGLWKIFFQIGLIDITYCQIHIWQVILVKSVSWLRLHRHLRLRKRQPTMQGYAASWWMLDLRCSGPLLTKYIHQRLYIQFWEVPQCITPHCNHCTKGGRKCWIPRNGESCTLLTHPCLLQPSISHF